MDDPAITYTFPLDAWQQEAIAAIHRKENVLVTAKTGSGKTLVGEYQIAYSLRQKKRVFYTTPIKSLTNQKFHDLKHLFPKNSVGIMTGDIKSNPEADIVVMTTEILRNLLFKQSTSTATIGTAGQLTLQDLDAVVFDEVHYINDPDRGHVWEETLILLPPQIHLILLSATIDSAKEFAQWLSVAKGVPCNLLQTTHRIVPLIHGIYVEHENPLPLRTLKDGDEAPYNPTNYIQYLKQKRQKELDHDKWKQQVRNSNRSGDSLGGSKDKVTIKSFTHQLNECVDTLQKKDLLPALFFVFSRKECERYAEQVTHTLIDSSASAAMKHIIHFHLHKYDEQLKHLPQYHQLMALLEKGIAFHHSGVLPLLKEMVELLFAKGFIKILFCTETFAVGLNMPTRTAVFLDLKKPSEQGLRPLRPDEYIQMAGRAGRRGKDKQGVVIYLPARNPVEPDDLSRIMSGTLQPLTSRIQFHYDFVLKALHAASATSATGQTPIWEMVLESSYWNAQRQHMKQAAQSQLTTLEQEETTIKITEDQIHDLFDRDTLVNTVQTSVNAPKRKAQQELERWNERHRGPTWVQAMANYERITKLHAECRKLRDFMSSCSAPTSERVDPVLNALKSWGALEDDRRTLTKFGIYATEINEGNSLLIAKLYDSQLLKNATEEEIVTVLGSFIVDGEALTKSSHPTEIPVSDTIRETLLKIDEWGCQGVQIDKEFGITSPDSFWSLATLWVQIAQDWLAGASAAHISKTYDIYEGNLMRGLHKLVSLVNEWTAVATINGDVDMLAKLRATPQKLTRDIAIPESLYLRL
jgi:superfamily II RNA helicase